jgi:hypothetical protein
MSPSFVRSPFASLVCRMLIVCITLLPFQAQAGLVGTDAALPAARAPRDAVHGFISRADVAAQLQAFGIPAQSAIERVDALSDAEVAGLAGRIDALPAGAIAGVLPIIVVALLIYYLIAVPASTPKEPAKPAAK